MECFSFSFFATVLGANVLRFVFVLFVALCDLFSHVRITGRSADVLIDHHDAQARKGKVRAPTSARTVRREDRPGVSRCSVVRASKTHARKWEAREGGAKTPGIWRRGGGDRHPSSGGAGGDFSRSYLTLKVT